jgi:hypothetical protein
MEMDIDELSARLARLEDERAVLDNLHRYGYSIDYGLEDDWVDCFLPDVRFEVRRRLETDNLTVCEGEDALRRFVANHTRPPARYHKHIVVDSRIVVAGDRATSVSYFIRVDADIASSGRSFVHAMGRYHDTLARCDDGRWRFIERLAEVEDR